MEEQNWRDERGRDTGFHFESARFKILRDVCTQIRSLAVDLGDKAEKEGQRGGGKAAGRWCLGHRERGDVRGSAMAEMTEAQD